MVRVQSVLLTTETGEINWRKNIYQQEIICSLDKVRNSHYTTIIKGARFTLQERSDKMMENNELLKNARKLSGMTQKDFAEYFYVPLRTYKDWELGNTKMADYILRLVLYKLEMEKIIPTGLLASMDEK